LEPQTSDLGLRTSDFGPQGKLHSELESEIAEERQESRRDSDKAKGPSGNVKYELWVCGLKFEV